MWAMHAFWRAVCEGLLEYCETKSVATNKGGNKPTNFMRSVDGAGAKLWATPSKNVHPIARSYYADVVYLDVVYL